VAWFDDDASAARAVDAALDAKVTPRALEFVDARALSAVAAHTGDAQMARRRALILVECDGSPSTVDDELASFDAALRPHAALVEQATGHAAERLWDARRAISPAVTARWPHRFAEDICVPRTQFVTMIGELHRIAAEHGLLALGFGHAGDGNIHASILLPSGSDADRARGKLAVAEVFRRALELGGTLSAEHGIAITKREFLPLELSPENRAAQRSRC
jgi:FAD/FMN-containing dehydrogenase